MEQWEKDLGEIIARLADEVEHFFLGVGEMVDVFFEATAEFTEQVQNSIASEVDEFWHEIAEPILDVCWDLEDIFTDTDVIFPYGVEATTEENPACRGCEHYHGQVYNGSLLVCAMHPYGWEGENCPDWRESP